MRRCEDGEGVAGGDGEGVSGVPDDGSGCDNEDKDVNRCDW